MREKDAAIRENARVIRRLKAVIRSLESAINGPDWELLTSNEANELVQVCRLMKEMARRRGASDIKIG